MYDVIVIGAGSGGLTAAAGASNLGAKVALINDSKDLGGECLHTGCVPSKALIHLSKKHNCKMDSNFDIKKVMQEVDKKVSQIQKEDSIENFEEIGVDVYVGIAKFIDNYTVEYAPDKRLSAKKIIVSTGSLPLVPKIPGLDEIDYYTNENIFQMTRTPKAFAIVGGGAIGLEMASAFTNFGVDVHLFEAGDFLAKEDDLISRYAYEDLSKKFHIHIHSVVKEFIRIDDHKVKIIYETDSQNYEIIVDSVLMGVGRSANTKNLELHKAGIDVDEKGYIITNKYLQTNQSHIYAIGDVNAKFQFTHMAREEGKLAISNALVKFKRKISYNNIPWTIFTDNEITHIGLTEQEALNQYDEEEIYVFEVETKDIDRFITDEATSGVFKIITKKNGLILGAHAYAKDSGTWMQSINLAINESMRITSLSSPIYQYPSYNEIIRKAADTYYHVTLFNEDNVTNKVLKRWVRITN